MTDLQKRTGLLAFAIALGLGVGVVATAFVLGRGKPRLGLAWDSVNGRSTVTAPASDKPEGIDILYKHAWWKQQPSHQQMEVILSMLQEIKPGSKFCIDKQGQVRNPDDPQMEKQPRLFFAYPPFQPAPPRQTRMQAMDMLWERLEQEQVRELLHATFPPR